MCRHAVDGAIRQLALRWAVTTGADLHATAAEIDQISLTRRRLVRAATYGTPAEPSPGPAAETLCAPYLTGWNQATHDTGGDASDGLAAEIAAARDACALLAGWGSK